MKITDTIIPLSHDFSNRKPEKSAPGFGQLFTQLVQQTVENQIAANELGVKLALGETDDVQAVMLAAEKASLSWQLLQQVRNKLLEAYQEVVRMQI